MQQDRGTALIPATVRDELAALMTDVQVALYAEDADLVDGLEQVFYRLESVVEEIDAAA